MSNDLREFINIAEEMGEAKLIKGADCESEPGTLTELLGDLANPRLFLFDGIKGYRGGHRVFSNLFSVHRRRALGLGLPQEAKGVELVRASKDKITGGQS